MLTKTFVCEEHEEYGGLGWREKNKPHFAPFQGLAVAHDCLEHFPDDGPEIEHEMQALGAMMHVRGVMVDNGYRSYECWENLQSDMRELFMLYRYQNVRFNSPPRTAKLPLDQEDQLDKLMKNLRNFLLTELGYDEAEKERDPTTGDRLTSFIRRVRGWLRIGYRRAVRRWRLNTYEIYSVFNEIQRQADKFLKYANAGDEIKVSVSMLRQRVVVTHSTYYDLNPDEFEDAS